MDLWPLNPRWRLRLLLSPLLLYLFLGGDHKPFRAANPPPAEPLHTEIPPLEAQVAPAERVSDEDLEDGDVLYLPREAQGGATLGGTVMSRERRPIAKALLAPWKVIEGPGEARSLPVVPIRTNDKGQFLLTGLPEGTYRLNIVAKGYQRTVVERLILGRGEDRRDLEVLLAQGFTIGGKVQDRDGQPVDGAVILASPVGGGAEEETITAKDGSFTLKHLGQGTYDLLVRATGYHDGGAEAKGGDKDLAIVLESQGGVRGRVMDEGQPVGGALVELSGSGFWPPRKVRSDPTGVYSIAGVPLGIYQIQAWKGSRASPEMIAIEVGEMGDVKGLDLELQPAVVLRGTVRLAGDRKAVAGARLTLATDSVSVSPRHTISNSDGTYRFEGVLPGSYLLSAEHPSFAPVSAFEVAIKLDDSQRPVDILLPSGGVVWGRVISSGGQPIAGATVEARSLSLAGVALKRSARVIKARDKLWHRLFPGLPPMPLGSTLRTNAKGEFRISGVPPGQIQVAAKSSDHAEAVSDPLTLEPSGEIGGLTLVLAMGGVLMGRITDGEGYPLEGVRITALDDGASSQGATASRGDGSYRMAGLQGEYRVEAEAAGYVKAVRRDIKIKGGQEDTVVDFQLRRAEGRLEGLVEDDRGVAVELARVRLFSQDPLLPQQASASTGSDGRFVFKDLAGGPFTLQVSHPDYASVEQRDIPMAAEVRIQLRSGGRIRGWVRDGASGGAVGRFTLRVRAREEGGPGRLIFEAVTQDQDGAFRTGLLPAGPTWLEAVAPGYVPYSGRGPSIASGEEQEATLDLQQGGSISGWVLDQGGEPLAGALVKAFDPRGKAAYTTGQAAPGLAGDDRSNAKGEFSIDGLAPGSYSVEAKRGEASATAPGYIQVEPGLAVEEITIELEGPQDDRPESPPLPLRADPGLRLKGHKDELIVASIRPGSPADRAGVLRGDRLLAIDGREVRESDLDQARELLSGTAGTTVILQIARGPQEDPVDFVILREAPGQ